VTLSELANDTKRCVVSVTAELLVKNCHVSISTGRLTLLMLLFIIIVALSYAGVRRMGGDL